MTGFVRGLVYRGILLWSVCSSCTGLSNRRDDQDVVNTSVNKLLKQVLDYQKNIMKQLDDMEHAHKQSTHEIKSEMDKNQKELIQFVEQELKRDQNHGSDHSVTGKSMINLFTSQ